MSTNNKIAYLKRLLKRTLYVFIGILIVLNLFILISGRTYLYTGLRWTYLVGKSGPTIYDSTMTEHNLINPKTHPVLIVKSKNIFHYWLYFFVAVRLYGLKEMPKH